MKMNHVTPELPVSDVAEAVTALEKIGFRKAWDYEDSFACVYGGDEIEIFLRQQKDTAPVTLYLKVDDADSFYSTCQEHAELLEPIHNTPWGMREFTIRTVGGHVFRVGHGDQDGGDRRKLSENQVEAGSLGNQY